ncbi:DUF2254 domain-containing protein [Thalassospira xiamenensis]|uniref:DUF2254 domain-containing protein n=1 Tax=Thalassospira xiamenensis TaxID=220697 RepID=A0A367X3P2_9PROT|nr:DUF2254 domain-containing protein [Thalassospira xiamenensis]KZB51534.1 hypothetical protein AUP41_07425 [Thalassospira xiamenensis]RCK48197.1 hypothetical protein TH44_16930 [Thalassospira xiamenensis]
MFHRFIRIWEFLGHSLWFIPLLYAIGGAAVALLAIRLPGEDMIASLPDFWPRFGTVQTVQDLTSTLLATLVTMTTFALSVTMVVLTLAAGSLGPRTIRNFMGDPKTQNALGSFVGSILFLITALVIMGGQGKEDQVPQIAAITGILLFVVSLFVLILFVHHLGRSIVADQVIQKVGGNLEETIASSLETLSQPIDHAVEAGCTLPDAGTINPDRAIKAAKSGYVQGIDYEGLLELATKTDIHIALTIHAGQHVIAEDIIGEISINSANATSDIGEYRNFITEQILIGNQRTAMLDIEFALRQLVEVALRALSPGINDPFTAIAVIYRLGRAMPQAMNFHSPLGLWRDEQGQERICAHLSDFGEMLDAAFNQIRQSASTKPYVLLPMAEVLESLIGQAKTVKQQDTLRDHARLIGRTAARNIAEAADRRAVERAVNRVLRQQQAKDDYSAA